MGVESKNNREEALVLLSGGLDSAVALYWALKKKKMPVRILTFNYFRRSEKEIEAANLLAKESGCTNLTFDLEFLKEIDDIRKQNRNPDLRRAPSAYIPSRNVVFYGIASSVAEIYDCKYIIGGHNKDDVKSFPDSSEKFFAEFNKLTSYGLFSGSRTGRVILPLAQLKKAQVVELGGELGVPFDLTWSCYFQYKVPCRKCPACKLRAVAFREAGLTDPLIKS